MSSKPGVSSKIRRLPLRRRGSKPIFWTSMMIGLSSFVSDSIDVPTLARSSPAIQLMNYVQNHIATPLSTMVRISQCFCPPLLDPLRYELKWLEGTYTITFCNPNLRDNNIAFIMSVAKRRIRVGHFGFDCRRLRFLLCDKVAEWFKKRWTRKSTRTVQLPARVKVGIWRARELQDRSNRAKTRTTNEDNTTTTRQRAPPQSINISVDAEDKFMIWSSDHPHRARRQIRQTGIVISMLQRQKIPLSLPLIISNNEGRKCRSKLLK